MALVVRASIVKAPLAGLLRAHSVARRSASVGMLCVSSASAAAGRSLSSFERPRPRPSVELYSNRARPCARVATAAAVGWEHSPALGSSHPPLEALLPPGHDLRDSYVPNRVADVSRYWAIPNLRPLRESSETILAVLKVSSALILAASMGTVVYHNVQLAAEERAAGRVADVEVDDTMGYGHAYGFGYGYGYGYGYGHAYASDEVTNRRGAPTFVTVSVDDVNAARERWSDSANPVKRTAAKVGIGLKGLWDALPG